MNTSPFENQPEIPPARNDLDINMELTSKDIATAISSLNSHKAAGPGLILLEALKADMEISVEILHTLLENI